MIFFQYFLLGAVMAIGFFMMSSFVMVLESGVSDWLNVAASIALVFMLKVAMFHSLIISPTINTNDSPSRSHYRFLFLLLGVWSVVIPYIEVEAVANSLKSAFWELGLMISRLL